MKSDVYIVRVESSNMGDRVNALKKLVAALSPSIKYKKDEIVPIKITVGDSACAFNVAPELIKVIVTDIKNKGTRPFLFDTSVIYKGSRQNAVDHMTLAYNKGMHQGKAGAPFIVADGLLGHDGVEIETDSKDIKKIKVPSFVGMLDSLVVVSHVTGHIISQYAGAMKNVAMGMACKPTKQVQHSSLKPSVIEKRCVACGQCVKICPAKAIKIMEKAAIDQGICVGCGECLCACKFNAILVNWEEDEGTFCRRMVDVAYEILKRFEKRIFFNFALDITKECDCISTKDETMVSGDIGILASSDPLAIDKACTDIMIKEKSSAFFSGEKTTYGPMYEYAAKRGLGNMDYKLITI